jgi:glycosyltransferase involved in cell wall biosynthesis
MEYKHTFTVFTPTYDRAYTLHRVFNSLKEQTFRDFEWLIVDDGSTDNTESLVKGWEKEVDFPIRYYYQENSGHQMAFNRGVKEAFGGLFLRFDSDDACLPNALECFKNHWDQIPVDVKNSFVGITSLCQNHHKKLIGTKFPQDVFDSDLLELKYKYKVKGEKWHLYRTDVLIDYPYPPVGNYLPPSVFRQAIALKYKTRFINQPLLIYFEMEEGRTDQISTNWTKEQSDGFAYYHQTVLNDQINWFSVAPKEFFRSAVHFSRFSFVSGKNVFQQAKELRSQLGKILWLLALPVGFLVFYKDRMKFSKK